MGSAGKHVAQVGDRLVGGVDHVVRFRPRDRLGGIGDEHCPRKAVRKIVRDPPALASGPLLESGPGADENLDKGLASGSRRSVVSRQLENRRYPFEELDIVWAVPGLIEAKLMIERHLFQIRQE